MFAHRPHRVIKFTTLAKALPTFIGRTYENTTEKIRIPEGENP